MKEVERTQYSSKPSALMNLGKGQWYYNYDIQPYEVEIAPRGEEKTGSKETRYSFIQVRISGKPTYKKCVELIIRQYITQSQEFDLINSYNKASLNMLSEEETEKACADYLEYLHKLDEIKANVKKDFE